MSNEKEQIMTAKRKRSKESHSQESKVSEQGEQQPVHKSTLENHMKTNLLCQEPDDRFPVSTKNYIVYIDSGLAEYGRKAVMRKWDPDTPRLTESERELLKMATRRERTEG